MSRSLIVALCVLCGLLTPRVCRANLFDDLGEAVASVSGLRGIARGAASGAASGVREQLEQLFDDKVNPLLDRANAILADRLDQLDNIVNQRIQQAATVMIGTLRETEAVLRNVIAQLGETAVVLIDKAFYDANQSLDRLFGRIDTVVNDLVCALAPARDGIQIRGIPLGDREDQVRVRWPARTKCYAKFVAAGGRVNPKSVVFSGWEFYAGEICEAEASANDISPSDPDAVEKLKYAYERAAALVRSALCLAPTPTSRQELLARKATFERNVRLYSSLLDGSSPILR